MFTSENKNYYETLEVPTDASQEEIQKSYNRAQNAYAEDSVAMYSLMTKDECQRVLQEIEEAYSVLSIPEKRREYDKVKGIKKVNITDSIHAAPIHSSDINGMSETSKVEPVRPNAIVDDMFSVDNSESSQEKFVYNKPDTNDSIVEEHAAHQDYLKFDKDTSVKKQSVEVAKFSAINKFSLNYDVDEVFEDEINNTTSFTGDFLKKIREYKNVDLERVADATKISKTAIRNLEDENFNALPAVVYTRGFLFQYAKFLKLNPDIVCNDYMQRYKEFKKNNR